MMMMMATKRQLLITISCFVMIAGTFGYGAQRAGLQGGSSSIIPKKYIGLITGAVIASVAIIATYLFTRRHTRKELDKMTDISASIPQNQLAAHRSAYNKDANILLRTALKTPGLKGAASEYRDLQLFRRAKKLKAEHAAKLATTPKEEPPKEAAPPPVPASQPDEEVVPELAKTRLAPEPDAATEAE